MGEVINLRLARKRRARADASVRADQNRRAFGRTAAEKAAVSAERARAEASARANQNRQLFGRTAAEKTRDAAEHARIEATLDGARLETPEPDNPVQ